MQKLPFLLILSFLLTACGPPLIFGITQEQWDILTPKQREQVIIGYNERQNIRAQTETVRAQTEPLRAAIDALAAKNEKKKDNKTGDPFKDDPFFRDRDPFKDDPFFQHSEDRPFKPVI